MSKDVIVADGLMNVVSGLGTGLDKGSQNTYTGSNISDLNAAWKTSPWFRKIVEIPVDDCLREGRSWQADENQIELIEKEEKRLGWKRAVAKALKWARKDGGAAIVLGLPGEPDQPVNFKTLGKGSLKFLNVVSMVEIQPGTKDTDPLSEFYNRPTKYTMNGRDIHPSRVIHFNGREKQPQDSWDGWGDSEYLHTRDSIVRLDATCAGLASLLQEAKIDVISIPGLTELVATEEYENRLIRRFTVSNALKSLTNALILDGGDGDGSSKEVYEQKQVNWAGLPDIVTTQCQILAGASDIPLTRLIGRSPAGMNSTGESDMRNYYDKLASYQELEIAPTLSALDNYTIVSALGTRPDDIWVRWEPLYQMSEKEAAEVEKVYSELFDNYATSGLVDTAALQSIVRTHMINSGQFAGAEAAFEEADKGLAVVEVDEPVIAVADAAPRTLYIMREVINKKQIADWAKSQGIEDLVDDLHVTVAYSNAPVDWIKVGMPWSSDAEKLVIPKGGPRLMEKFNGGAIVLQFASDDLLWRHQKVIDVGGSYDFEEYQPHVTLTYTDRDISTIEPYQGRILLGPEIFSEVKS